jgi:hypothetical protein
MFKNIRSSEQEKISNTSPEKINLNNFDGWLLLFYIGAWSTFLIILILAALQIVTLFESNAIHWPGELFIILFLAIMGLIEFQIIRLMRQKDPSVPEKIVSLRIWELVWLIIGSIIVFLCSKFIVINKIAMSLLGGIYFGFSGIKAFLKICVWWMYYRNSKRVQAYYGKNAGKINLISIWLNKNST